MVTIYSSDEEGLFVQSSQEVSYSENERPNYSNRGMGLEQILNRTNNYYNNVAKCAVIYKKPTPIQIVKVDYSSKRAATTIREAYFKQPSTTDYNGIYKGHYIDFEAKETKNKTSLRLSNFNEHQVEHMRKVLKQDGISFEIIRFTLTEEYFLLYANHVISFWDNQKYGGRKSITKNFIENNGYRIELGLEPELNYLKCVDKYID